VSERIVRYFLAIPILAFPSLVFPAEWNSISGIYAVTAENLIDPGESEPRDSHYRIQLKGGSAKALYQAMKVSPQIDECTGASAKTVGEMQCLYFEGDGDYECHFSLNIAEQKIEYGVVC
jgi:hypothetical protein